LLFEIAEGPADLGDRGARFVPGADDDRDIVRCDGRSATLSPVPDCFVRFCLLLEHRDNRANDVLRSILQVVVAPVGVQN
jgi:hypothetical protein